MISILDTPRLLQLQLTVIHTHTHTHTYTHIHTQKKFLRELDASRAYDVM